MLESEPKEMNMSSPERGVLSSYDCIDEHDEKEVSDEDDDDRNHKHRRRDTNSQLFGQDAADQGFTRPYRKRNKFNENGYPFRENESQGGETWKDSNTAFLEKEVSGKFDKRRLTSTSFPRISDFNNKYRANQIPPGDVGFGRGRGRNPGAWNQRDSRFSSADIASQIVHQVPIPPSLFAGRGLPNLANPQSTSWSAYGNGLMPGIPNGSLDMMNSFGLLGSIGQPINSSMNIVMPRQRCRDFEERGFCLRGDMCPMEHGVNRIVVEDVQSLSQFNLPVSVPSTHLMGKSPLPGSLPTTGSSSTTLKNSKELHSNSSKPRLTVADDSLTLNGTYSDFVAAGVADLYDPDQPLWNNRHESASLLELKEANIDETMLNDDPSDRQHTRISDSAGNEFPVRSNVNTVVSQSANTTVWGRMGNSKNRLEEIEKTDPTISSSGYVDNEKEDTEVLGKRIKTEDSSKEMNMSLKTKNDIARNTRKPSQKALRTLFVNGIPKESNKRETLLSHFKKFGEVIDIYIPANSDRAFVQFFKREDAEAALMAPDAVMGNRFIKLWWANRDSVLDNGLNNGSFSAPHGATHQTSIRYSANRGSETLESSAPKGKVIYSSDVSVSDSELPKPLNGPKVPLKKLQSLELMKEELRKKQEMLDQKRNDFRRKLDKLEKQATGTKGEIVDEKVAKRPKVDIAADASKCITPKPSDPDSVVASPHAEIEREENTCVQNDSVHTPGTSSSPEVQEGITLVPPVEREKSPPPTPKGSSEPDVHEESDHSKRNGVEKAIESEENSELDACCQ